MRARILVIEDDPPSLELACYLLAAAGYTALTAENGLDGLAKAEAERPDLIICDIHMPKMDGYQLLTRLRQNHTLRAIPVIAVTASSMIGDRQRILDTGFEGYISKPIVPESFVGQVTDFLPLEMRSPTAHL